MDHVYNSGASGTPPAATENTSSGYPTNGNPGVTPATVPGAYLFHMLVEEMRNAIVAAGLTPDKTNVSQLATAIATIAAGNAKVTSYAATLTNLINDATADSEILSFTVPANAWGDKEEITVSVLSLVKNNKGSAGTVTFKVKVGAGASLTVASASSWVDDVLEYAVEYGFKLRRIGSTVYIWTGGTGGGWATAWSPTVAPQAAGVSGGSTPSGTSTPTNFTTNITVQFLATLSAANSAFYIKPQGATVTHRKA